MIAFRGRWLAYLQWVWIAVLVGGATVIDADAGFFVANAVVVFTFLGGFDLGADDGT